MMPEYTQIKEAEEFMGKLKGFVEILQPEGMDGFINFCNQVIPTIVGLEDDLEEAGNLIRERDSEIYSLNNDISDLEDSTNRLTSEIEQLNNTICCLESSEGKSRY